MKYVGNSVKPAGTADQLPSEKGSAWELFHAETWFNFHLDHLRILWIKIHHSVLWSKSHSCFFLTQSLVQNKSIFFLSSHLCGSKYLARTAMRNFGSSLQCLCYVIYWDFRECPVGCCASPAETQPVPHLALSSSILLMWSEISAQEQMAEAMGKPFTGVTEGRENASDKHPGSCLTVWC